jgi:hypothetical protein
MNSRANAETKNRSRNNPLRSPVINKVLPFHPPTLTFTHPSADTSMDLAPHINASLEIMAHDAEMMRGDGPTVFTCIKEGKVRSHHTLTHISLTLAIGHLIVGR